MKIKSTDLIIKILFFLTLLISCEDRPDLELEIVNKTLISGRPNMSTVARTDSESFTRSGNMVVYYLKNNSNNTYYFNGLFGSNLIGKINAYHYGAMGMVFSSNKKDTVEVSYHTDNSRYSCDTEIYEYKNAYAKYLGYNIEGSLKEALDNYNFVIHPQETLYFEFPIDLPSADRFQSASVGLDPSENNFASIFIYSDSTDYKKYLSRADLKDIKKNKYIVYHGLINSNNKIPIKFRSN